MKYNKIIGLILVATVGFGMGQAMASSSKACPSCPSGERLCYTGFSYTCLPQGHSCPFLEGSKKDDESSWRRSEGGSGASGTKEYRPGFLPVRDGSVKSGTNTTPSSADDDTTSNN